MALYTYLVTSGRQRPDTVPIYRNRWMSVCDILYIHIETGGRPRLHVVSP